MRDREGTSSQYLVLDNAKIDIDAKELSKLVLERGHYVAYMPSWSSFLSPVEEFWAKLKSWMMKRKLHSEQHTLQANIYESYQTVTIEDCRS